MRGRRRERRQPVRHLLHGQRNPDAPGHPAAGNFLQQELAILTGAVEAMVVDVQCIMQALVDLAGNFHTKVITTSPKVKITGATHIEFDEHKALTIAKQILRVAIDNYKNRAKPKSPMCGKI